MSFLAIRDDVAFVEHLNYQGMQLDIRYKGKVSGNEIMFTRTIMDVAEQLVATCEVAARRKRQWRRTCNALDDAD